MVKHRYFLDHSIRHLSNKITWGICRKKSSQWKITKTKASAFIILKLLLMV